LAVVAVVQEDNPRLFKEPKAAPYCLFFRLLLVCLVFAKIIIPDMNTVKPEITNIIGTAINVDKLY